MKIQQIRDILDQFFPNSKPETRSKASTVLLDLVIDDALSIASEEADKMMKESIANVDNIINTTNNGYLHESAVEG